MYEFVETVVFQRHIDALLSPDSLVMPSTEGCRLPDIGKRHAIRVVYHVHQERDEIYLLQVFSNQDKYNFLINERNEIKRVVWW